MQRNGTSRKLSLERLEDRSLMAGNVTAVVSGGYLNITGDDLANSISIEATATAGTYRIHGQVAGAAQTKVNNVDTSVPGNFVEVTGVKQGVKIELKGGDDRVSFGSTAQTSTSLPRWLEIDTGIGNDVVEIGRAGNAAGGIDPVALAVIIRTQLTIDTGEGNDQVSLANVNARKQIKIDTGAGDDQVLFPTTYTPISGTQQAFPVRTSESLKINLGAGADELTGSHLSIKHDLKIFDSSGATEITLAHSNIGNKLNIDTRDGIDIIALDHIIAFKFGLNTNEGADEVSIRDSRFKRVDIDLGADNDRLTIGDTRVSQLTLLDGGLGRADLFDEGGNSFRNRVRRRF